MGQGRLSNKTKQLSPPRSSGLGLCLNFKFFILTSFNMGLFLVRSSPEKCSKIGKGKGAVVVKEDKTEINQRSKNITRKSY